MKKIALVIAACTISFSSVFGVFDWYNPVTGQITRQENSCNCACVKAACLLSTCSCITGVASCVAGAALIKAAPVVCAGKCADTLIVAAAMCWSVSLNTLGIFMPGHVPPAPQQQNNIMKRD